MKGEEASEKFLSKSAFAARQCWSPSYVTKLKDQGRLVMHPDNPRLVDVAATLANLESTGDPHKSYLRQYHMKERIEKHVTSLIQPGVPTIEDDLSTSAGPRYWESKARRESSLASLAQDELERRRTELVDRQGVEGAASAIYSVLAGAFLDLCPLLASEIANMTDAFQIEIRLRDAFRQVLADTSKTGVEDLLKVTDTSR